MVVLRCVDHWVHKSHLVYKATRNCSIVEQETTNSSRLGRRSREQRNFSSESDRISKVLPSQQLERFLQTGVDLVEHRQVRQFDKVQV